MYHFQKESRLDDHLKMWVKILGENVKNMENRKSN